MKVGHTGASICIINERKHVIAKIGWRVRRFQRTYSERYTGVRVGVDKVYLQLSSSNEAKIKRIICSSSLKISYIKWVYYSQEVHIYINAFRDCSDNVNKIITEIAIWIYRLKLIEYIYVGDVVVKNQLSTII